MSDFPHASHDMRIGGRNRPLKTSGVYRQQANECLACGLRIFNVNRDGYDYDNAIRSPYKAPASRLAEKPDA